MPLLRSATGQVFFAFGDPVAMDAHAVADRGGDFARLDLVALRSRVRAACSASVRGDLIPGLRAISAPVFDLQGRLALAATAIAHGGIDRKDDVRTDAALRAACQRLTESLGGRWPEHA